MDAQQETPAREPVYVVEGEKVALGLFTPDMVDLWTRWMNDFEVTRTLGLQSLTVHSHEEEQRFYERNTRNDYNVSFAIYERSSRRPIGSTGLNEIDYRAGVATFGIFIGERSCWNKGYGTETTRLVLDFGFHVLGLHNILLNVFETNPRGQRAYEKAGFRLIGRRRQAFKVGQRRYDIIFMDALAAEFESPVLDHLLHRPQELP